MEELKLAKAELIELTRDLKGEQSGGNRVGVQFNPDTLKVSFSNQVSKPNGKGSQKGSAGWLFVGEGNTKLSFQLWFDVSRKADLAGDVKDVRELTRQVAFFMKPGPAQGGGGDEKQYIPHPVRFHWGTFTFDGIMDTMEETLDYWSHEGTPLRASINVSMSQQKIDALADATQRKSAEAMVGRLVGEGGRAAGTSQLTAAPAGGSIQSLADAAGQSNWQAIAAANGIENPRQLLPGQLLNLNPPAPKFF